MTLLAQARASLQTATAPFGLRIEDGPQRLECDFSALDSLACAFTSFVVSADTLTDVSAEQLRRLGEKLSARLTYLLEPINPIEFDREQCVVQLRSNPPERDEDRTSYYELVVRRGGTLSLCRFAKQPGEVRRTIPVNVTREVFFRLVSDFSAAAGG
jgi:hypothetical protein